MTTKIIYHEIKPGTPCPDGIMAAAIARLAYPDAVLIGDGYRHESEYGAAPDVEGVRGEVGDRSTDAQVAKGGGLVLLAENTKRGDRQSMRSPLFSHPFLITLTRSRDIPARLAASTFPNSSAIRRISSSDIRALRLD